MALSLSFFKVKKRERAFNGRLWGPREASEPFVDAQRPLQELQQERRPLQQRHKKDKKAFFPQWLR